MNKIRMRTGRIIGIAALAFGAGVFLAFFFPLRLLAAIEAAVILIAGIWCMLQRG